jgi:tetratricopeptide (TPR) repeat protein
MATGKYEKAIQTLESWLKNNQPDEVQIYVLLANAHAQLHHYRQALPYIEKAIARSSAPKPAWYQLNLALYYELQNYKAAAKLLQRLIQIDQDNKDYWQQLVTVYQQLKQFPQAAAVKDLGLKKEVFSTEKDILELVNLYLYIGAPYKSGVLLKNQIKNGKVKSTVKNWETLSNAWLMAKEFDAAIQALETASQLDDRGRLYEKLGQIYVEQEQWKPAISALTQAINKGGLNDSGEAHFLLAICYYELHQYQSAQKHFVLAQKSSRHKKDAGVWLEYIQNQSHQDQKG